MVRSSILGKYHNTYLANVLVRKEKSYRVYFFQISRSLRFSKRMFREQNHKPPYQTMNPNFKFGAFFPPSLRCRQTRALKSRKQQHRVKRTRVSQNTVQPHQLLHPDQHLQQRQDPDHHHRQSHQDERQRGKR